MAPECWCAWLPYDHLLMRRVGADPAHPSTHPPTHPPTLHFALPTPQADFASSAVDFLHRVGRTARAGKGGRVTSLYLPDVEALVGAIQDNIAAGGWAGVVGG